MEIKRDTIAQAHEAVVKAIIEEGPGIDIETSPGKWEKTWEYPEQVQIIVLHPDREPRVSEACAFGEKAMACYCDQLTTVTPPKENGFAYTYANRLRDYPLHDWLETNKRSGYRYIGNGIPDSLGHPMGFDQISSLIKRLVQNQESRRALAITWVPEIDANASHDQPCLQFVHFIIRKGQKDDGNDPDKNYLHLRAPFRSHDMLGGYGPNAVALEGLMEYVRKEYMRRTDHVIEIGTLTTTSSSAHLYWTRDADDLKRFKKQIGIS